MAIRTDNSWLEEIARPSSTSATLSSVASSTSTGVLKAANANRRGLIIYNDSTASLFVAFAATASSSAFTAKLAAGAYYEMPSPTYTGVVSGIWDVANGNARITEIA